MKTKEYLVSYTQIIFYGNTYEVLFYQIKCDKHERFCSSQFQYGCFKVLLINFSYLSQYSLIYPVLSQYSLI